MSKIGIITYHFANNYGAVLQCYALCSYLKSLGHDAWVLNAVSEKQSNNNSRYRKNNTLKALLKNLALLPFHNTRTERFKKYLEFRTENLHLTPLITNLEDLQQYVNENHFDYLISGSDQVFNPDILDFETSFFLPFAFSGKKIGYGVSVGKASVEKLQKYEGWIRDFNFMSVRESSAAERLRGMFSNISLVLDPVFLLEKKSWESFVESNNQKYVLLYYINSKYSNQYLRISKEIASKLNLNLVIVDARINKNVFFNKVITSAGPKEFLSLLSNATFVCTDSFHGTAFSILFEKKFICFEAKFRSSDTRKLNICKNAGLDDVIYYLDKSSQKLEEFLNYFYDYDKVKKNIAPYIKSSKQFLLQSLK